jgi:hypothetical protein
VLSPLTRKHGVESAVDEAIVKPLGLALHALLPETQPLRDRPSPVVFGRARDAHPVQAEFPESMVHHRPARLRHDPLALELFAGPLAQRGAAVLPVNAVALDHARQAAFVPDTSLQPVVLGELLEGPPDEVRAVLNGADAVHPGGATLSDNSGFGWSGQTAPRRAALPVT